MKTVQMTFEEDLLKRVDQAARRTRMTRSAFARRALREALGRLAAAELELKHRRGYQAKPVRRGEFDAWQAEQVWPE